MKTIADNERTTPTVNGSKAELQEMLQTFDTAMLTTMTPEGRFRARPMAIQKPVAELNCDLWFVTSLDSAKADEIAHEHQVGVSCFRPSDRAYLSISAMARTHRDPEQIGRLYQPSWDLWFPNGVKDPTIAVIQMQVERAEYWHPTGGSARVLFEIVKSLVSGKPATESLPPVKKV